MAKRTRPAVVVALVAAAAGLSQAGEPRIALLLADTRPDRLGPETRSARELATARHSAAVVRPLLGDKKGGGFVDEKGEAIPLDRFRVVWYHQGDSTDQRGPVYDPATIKALQGFVERGGGLFLSGAALAMIHRLGVEPTRPRLGGPGNDRSPAGLVPTEAGHPVFRSLRPSGGVVPISDRGYPAFADFHGSGGPSKGMLLARAPGSSENPLAEYKVGKGRVIVMGWRLPHYSHAANPHRANLERLTANILTYLAERKAWQKVVVKRRGRPERARTPPAAAGSGLFDQEVHSLGLAIRDLSTTYGERYPGGAGYLARLNEIVEEGDDGTKLAALRREALLANPLLDFEKLLIVKRHERNLGLPKNWQSNSSLRTRGYDNEIALMSLRGSGPAAVTAGLPSGTNAPGNGLATLFRPKKGEFVGDVDLDFDAERMLFSMPGANGRWQVHEMAADGTGLTELPLIKEKDVDNYDACYLPDGNVIFTSTAPFAGVPCVKGSDHVSNLYRYDRETGRRSGSSDGPAGPNGRGRIRQLSFDQDHNWCPTVLPGGRVLYLRWEYSDIPHFVSRILFHCNPDGTGQSEYYGSGSYWPNAMFYARPVPGRPTMFVAVVGGHHDHPRMGELVLFDAARGRFEADGAVRRLGKSNRGSEVEPIILDGLTGKSWPKFLHPYPLSEKYCIVSAKPTSKSRWGVYLVDVFDNMLLLREEKGYALLEPVPLRKTPRPPVIPSRVNLKSKDGLLYVTDVYEGPGLRGVPRGTVKKLRLITYHFAYHGMGGQQNRVGLDGPWDIKRVLGTVPVEEDGSALFRVPANTPISIQPLDKEGKAIQLMRSWTTVMPGETQSCVGCHEPQNTVSPGKGTIASRKVPSAIAPWYGPVRGFSFKREVQPVLDRYCTGCHNGKKRADGKVLPDFTARPEVHPPARSKAYSHGTKFTPSYMALRRYVRSPTIESDMHLLSPYEFHADTAKLVQMLGKGHNGVRLPPEAWDRLVTWIDLHTPAHGTWHEFVNRDLAYRQRDRRREMMKRYAGRDEDPEAIYEPPGPKAQPVVPRREPRPPAKKVTCPGWPFDAAEASRRQQAADPRAETIDLGEGVKLELVLIPAGEFVMGDAAGFPDERPLARVKIARPFWMGKFEVTNRQYAFFDPRHDSRLEHGDFLQFSVRERGYPLNAPDQPVVRVSWKRAMDFCRWLSEKTGRRFALPTEAQWEWACRAGTAGALYWGGPEEGFGGLANLADASLRRMDTFGWKLPSGAVYEWRPTQASVNDHHRVSARVGSYKPNPWGLHDMHGNVAEWTRTTYGPYPYRESDGRNGPDADGRKVARGGSFNDRPVRSRSAFRLPYRPWQPVFDVGFRVAVEER